jgi:hypothetical protein
MTSSEKPSISRWRSRANSAQEGVGEQRDVLAPFAQRRQVDGTVLTRK